MLNLGNPNAPTRVSGFYKVPLIEWARSRHRRLPDRGALLPYRGQKLYLPDGSVGGTARGPYPVNLSSTLQPILKLPAALAARAQALAREVRRDRLRREQTQVLLGGPLTFSGLEHAKSFRLKLLTPSIVRGTRRDTRHPSGPGVQYYEQEVSPQTASRRLIAGRMLADPRARSAVSTRPVVDYRAGNDFNAGLRQAVGTASGPSVSRVFPIEAPRAGSGPLAMILVGLVFFLVFGRR